MAINERDNAGRKRSRVTHWLLLAPGMLWLVAFFFIPLWTLLRTSLSSKAARFDPTTGGASAWIFTIARNLRIDAVRKERRGGLGDASDIDAEFVVDEAPHPDTALVSVQTQTRIRSALSELSEEQMRVIELSFYQEKAHAEIAETLGIPLGTVKSRLRLGMAKLRSLLGDLS